MASKGYTKTIGKLDPEFRFLVSLDPAFEEWRSFAAQWFKEKVKRSTKIRQASITKFFVTYLQGLQLDKRPKSLMEVDSVVPELWGTLGLDSVSLGTALRTLDDIGDFLDWVLREKLSEVDAEGFRVVPASLRNPFPRTRPQKAGDLTDPEFRHLLALDARMESWRELASEWLGGQRSAIPTKIAALNAFFTRHLLKHGLETNPYSFLRRDYPQLSFVDSMLAAKSLRKDQEGIAALKLSAYEAGLICQVHEFLAWVLIERLSVEDDNGQRLVPYEFHNPVPMANSDSVRLSETQKTPLAYRFIRELRKMLVQGPNFRDWVWAQQAIDGGKRGGDWFQVDPKLVNEADPDCVWRKRRTSDYMQKLGRPVEVIELWAPARAVAVYLKLELPLRTYQVRMLDSGESDTWRYESGKWRLNDSPHALGSERKPVQRGVFHRSCSGSGTETGAGIYINTNKTADVNKDESDKGYVIPWTHEPALFWLEKLRNWQERYNPIAQPTPWRDLGVKHFGRALPHQSVFEARGPACFLFRDAASADILDRNKPLPPLAMDMIWYHLLAELGKRCEARGETLDDGLPIQFTNPDSPGRTHFPLHALRVSLITAFALDGGVPFPVLSKLFAGHARIFMTLYYTKAGKAHVTEVMQEAEKRILANEAASYRRFLMEKSYQDIEGMFAFNSPDALKAVSQQKSAAGFVFEDKGICPVGCGLCDVGGDARTPNLIQPVYSPVAGYPLERNCVRCRFFLTGPAFLPALHAHFNSVSYLATECSERYVRFSEQVRVFEDARLLCEERGDLFTQHKELERINRYFEEEAEKLNKLGHDIHATTHLINRCMAIANSKDEDGVRLVAVGGISDIQYALTETSSEMHQLEIMCQNAVIYPEVDASKATLRRSQILDAMLAMNGKPPILFRLNPDQQLRVGNAVMQLIQARTGSIAGAVEFAEGRRRLSEFGLLDETVELIEAETGGLAFRQILNDARSGLLLTCEEAEREDDHEA